MNELKDVNELCWEIEKLPASEQQTKVSLMAVEFVGYYKDISSALHVEELAHERTRAELARKEAVVQAAKKIDWGFAEDAVRNPGDYSGDEYTAKLIRKLAAALEQLEGK